jgi:hypothetical protein
MSPPPRRSGNERYSDDLALMYFAGLDPTSGSLRPLELVLLQIKNFRLFIAPQQDTERFQQTPDRECQRFGTRVSLGVDGPNSAGTNSDTNVRT